MRVPEVTTVARRALSILSIVLLLGGTAAAQDSATLWGLVLDRGGNPIPGYAVVLENTVTRATMTTPVSDSGGQYELLVPSPGSYRATAVVSRGGARFVIEGAIPVQVRRPVRYRLDVIVPDPAKPGSAAALEPPSAPAPGGAQTAAGSESWWKTPGGITALVAIQGAILAVFLSNDDDEPSASPSQP
jgi:hypothetical protein